MESKQNIKQEKVKNLTLWVDGCFDMFHYGHANVMRQAKELFPGSYLIVGVHSDEAILRNKGPTVMKNQERYDAVRNCRWVDEVYEDAPYVTSVKILEKRGVKYCLHGDDISLDCTGNNAYREVIAAGLYYTVPRTRGVSTTNILRRLLSHSSEGERKKFELTVKDDVNKGLFLDEDRIFFPSALQIKLYSSNLVAPEKDHKVVYVDGTFDLFHVGHIEFLKKAKELGDYLIVGVHSDDDIEVYKGKGFPILNTIERALGVLSCRYVDNVILGAPFCITKTLLKIYNVSVVAHGSTCDVPVVAKKANIDPYLVPKKLGILESIKSPRTDLHISTIITRVVQNSKLFLERNKSKVSEKEIFEKIDEEH